MSEQWMTRKEMEAAYGWAADAGKAKPVRITFEHCNFKWEGTALTPTGGVDVYCPNCRAPIYVSPLSKANT